MFDLQYKSDLLKTQWSKKYKNKSLIRNLLGSSIQQLECFLKHLFIYWIILKKRNNKKAIYKKHTQVCFESGKKKFFSHF